jgi:hypothetical protein
MTGELLACLLWLSCACLAAGKLFKRRRQPRPNPRKENHPWL